jgi:hypothetical protein
MPPVPGAPPDGADGFNEASQPSPVPRGPSAAAADQTRAQDRAGTADRAVRVLEGEMSLHAAVLLIPHLLPVEEEGALKGELAVGDSDRERDTQADNKSWTEAQ